MNGYVAILRGINVGGHRKILMADLKKLMEQLGFDQVTTYIQSGNVVFLSDEKMLPDDLAQKISQAITGKFSFEVPVVVRTFDEMQQTLKNNPFSGDRSIDPQKVHVTFLSQAPEEEFLHEIREYDYPPDTFIPAGKEIYLHCPEGYGNTRLTIAFFESKLHVTATARNWKTVNVLTGMLEKMV
jgi:uncharacterized protein (DUF1697 family)